MIGSTAELQFLNLPQATLCLPRPLCGLWARGHNVLALQFPLRVTPFPWRLSLIYHKIINRLILAFKSIPGHRLPRMRGWAASNPGKTSDIL